MTIHGSSSFYFGLTSYTLLSPDVHIYPDSSFQSDSSTTDLFLGFLYPLFGVSPETFVLTQVTWLPGRYSTHSDLPLPSFILCCAYLTISGPTHLGTSGKIPKTKESITLLFRTHLTKSYVPIPNLLLVVPVFVFPDNLSRTTVSLPLTPPGPSPSYHLCHSSPVRDLERSHFSTLLNDYLT